MTHQLALQIGLSERSTFDNYLSASNRAAVDSVQQVLEQDNQFLYLWGKRGSGKTHLLQAACHQLTAQNKTSAYLPLVKAMGQSDLSPQMIDGLETLSLVCIDDIHAIAGQREWEVALFDLHNRIRDIGSRLIIAGESSPAALGFELKDLTSRMTAALVFQLRELDDEGKIQALQRRADGRGVELPSDVASYMLKRCPRDMNALFGLLDRLDQASLSAQRKLTIPFVRGLI